MQSNAAKSVEIFILAQQTYVSTQTGKHLWTRVSSLHPPTTRETFRFISETTMSTSWTEKTAGLRKVLRRPSMLKWNSTP